MGLGKLPGGQVRKAEGEALKHLVKGRWVPLESSRDEFGVDAAEYINMGFDHAHDNALDAGAAFDRFVNAYREHARRFDPALKELVMETAVAVADAFGHANKAELTSLFRIQQLFREQA